MTKDQERILMLLGKANIDSEKLRDIVILNVELKREIEKLKEYITKLEANK